MNRIKISTSKQKSSSPFRRDIDNLIKQGHPRKEAFIIASSYRYKINQKIRKNNHQLWNQSKKHKHSYRREGWVQDLDTDGGDDNWLDTHSTPYSGFWDRFRDNLVAILFSFLILPLALVIGVMNKLLDFCYYLTKFIKRIISKKR